MPEALRIRFRLHAQHQTAFHIPCRFTKTESQRNEFPIQAWQGKEVGFVLNYSRENSLGLFLADTSEQSEAWISDGTSAHTTLERTLRLKHLVDPGRSSHATGTDSEQAIQNNSIDAKTSSGYGMEEPIGTQLNKDDRSFLDRSDETSSVLSNISSTQLSSTKVKLFQQFGFLGASIMVPDQ